MMRVVALLSALSVASAFTMNMAFNFNFGGKKAAAPAKKGAAPAKKGAAKKAESSGFAGGLVGIATENPFLALPLEFDPLKLSVGKSEETLAWYRAAELKVRYIHFICLYEIHNIIFMRSTAASACLLL